MKQSQVKPGVVAMLSLGGRRGSVRVTVTELYSRTSPVCAQPLWLVVDSLGRDYHVTSRQLQPMPRGFGLIESVDHEAMLRMQARDALRIVSSEPGQTIDAGDVVIETTLHRLG